MRKIIFILFLFLLGFYDLSAQNISTSATIDTNFILIGEQTNIEISVIYRVDEGELKIEFPTIYDTINEFVEVVEKSNIDTLIPDKNDPYLFKQTQQLTITSFDSGYYAIPPFQFVVNNDTIETAPLLLEVQSIEVDTSAAIFDIHSPLAVPFSFIDWLKENWTWLLGTLALIILITVLIIYLKNKKPTEVVKEIIPDIPPHVIAIERLESVQREKLWQSGQIKKYHSEISEIIREYIEKRYQINALEETTSEIMHELRLHGIDSKIMAKLNKTLVLADLVKFAKEQPIANENETSMADAIEFVNSTKIIENTNPENAQ